MKKENPAPCSFLPLMDGEQSNLRAFMNLLLVTFSLAAAFVVIYFCMSKICRRQRGRDVFLEFNGEAAIRADVAVSIEVSRVQLIPPSRIFRKVDVAGGEACGGSAGGGGGGEERMCAVCLSEFEDGEKVRFLPECGHCFHVECIDKWFRRNSTCPMCRQALTLLR
ncbi:RING-H2 finger protein ATL52-like [Dendrobium catenatum]|uniref:RING-H2 finger protein ATL44 n=1 Tax=Dendrobium catenatum TaxID=906689 RepID=A0A2I0X8S3_9ASPA|nr:RING-H2 finger protein ATL52-like [Dendrobium catenatum]PKU84291.1 RING-H2 finger protein ATL44 [Dendrobium catenatum]